MTTPIAAVIQGFRKYAVFDGRATRAEFWWWVLLIGIADLILGVVDNIIDASGGYGPFGTLFWLATLLPGLAVTVRRLHDIGKSGWWQLGWYVIPFVAWLAAGVMFLVAVVIKYSTAKASGGWSFDADDVPWESSTEAFAAFPPSAIMFIAALVITLAVIVWAIIWLARQGEAGQNRFGPDPRA